MRRVNNCAEANQIDLIDYLEILGYRPQKVSRNDYWYLSPLRIERTASFKVDRKLNLWYDHGIGKGGTLIDFITIYQGCSVKDALAKVNSDPVKFSFQQHMAVEKKESLASDNRIIIVAVRTIQSPSLKDYLSSRKIPIDIANQYCKEVDFSLNEKKYTAIGFQNNGGGFELRSAGFKGSSSPKDISVVKSSSSVDLIVFEGFIDFLSYCTLQQVSDRTIAQLSISGNNNFLILNSLAFVERSQKIMDDHKRIHLFLDRDIAGQKATRRLVESSKKCIDQSVCYAKFKDLNDLLVNKEIPKQRKGIRIRIR